MKKLLLIIGMAAALFACQKRTIYLRSCVTGYFGVKEITLKGKPEYSCVDIYASEGPCIAHYTNDGAIARVYDSLCIKHNDMTYQRRVFDIVPFSQELRYPAVDFLSLEITSDADYDATHPAGSSLADIVVFKSVSLKKFIDSGYTILDIDKEKYTTWYASGRISLYPVEKQVSELTPEDLILLGTGRSGGPSYHLGDLRFEEPPALSKTHTFTVTMAADDGSVFSASVEMTFN